MKSNFGISRKVGALRAPLVAGMTLMALALGGCNDDTPGATGPATTTISGIAAVGSPVEGGTVTLKCDGTGTIPSIAPTATAGGAASAGSWTVTLPSDVLPCVAGVTGGTVNGATNSQDLYTFIAATSAAIARANLTTLTTLIMAQAAHTSDLATWYSTLSAIDTLTAQVTTAQTALINALVTKGYLPQGVDPITADFHAENGDAIDDAMEALMTALDDASKSYADLLASFAEGAGATDLPAAPDSGDGGDGGTPGGDGGTPGGDGGTPGGDGGTPGGDGGDPSDLLNGKNGVALTIGSHTFKLANADVLKFEDNNRRELDVENTFSAGVYADPALVLGKAGLHLTQARVFVSKTNGAQTCGAAGTGSVKITLGLSGGSGADAAYNGFYTSDACAIQVSDMETLSGFAGTITSATLKNNNDPNTTITVSGGQFRVFQHTGTTGTSTDLGTSAFNVMNITQGTFEFPVGQYFKLDKNTGSYSGYSSNASVGGGTDDGSTVYDIGHASDNIVWILQNGPFNTTGDFACNTNNPYTNAKLNLYVITGTYGFPIEYSSITSGGACSFHITKVTARGGNGGFYTGSYTATLVAGGSMRTETQRTLKISGVVRNFTEVPIVAGGDNHNEGTLPSTGAVTTMLITDGNEHFTASHQFLMFDDDFALTTSGTSFGMNYQRRAVQSGSSSPTQVNGPAAATLKFQNVPRATGDAPCATGTGQPTMTLQTQQGINYTSSATGATCTIHVSKYDSTSVEGTYTAKLVNTDAAEVMADHDGTVQISGSFRRQGTGTN